MYQLTTKYLNKTSYPIIKLCLTVTNIAIFIAIILILENTFTEIYPLTKIALVLYNFAFFFSLYTSKIYDFEKFYLTRRKQIGLTYILLFIKEAIENSLLYFGLLYVIFSYKFYIPLEILLVTLTEELTLFAIFSVVYLLLENTMYIFLIPITNFVLWFVQDVMHNNILSNLIIKYDYNDGNPLIYFNPLITYTLIPLCFLLFLLLIQVKRRK